MQPSFVALLALFLGLAGSTASAQAPAAQPAEPAVLSLTLDEAVSMALEHNPSLAADRLDPQITDMEVAQADSAFAPTFNSVLQRRGQLSPPTNFLVGAEGTRTDTYTTTVGMAQRLRWAGTTYNLNWDSARESTNSFLNNFNPTLRSGVNFSISQPLLRDFSIDAARRQLITTRLDRTISGVGFRENTVQTVADTKRAYWDLVSARANVEVQERSLDLSRELVRMNQARVDVGNAPPLDLVSAQAEVALREEALIVAEALVKQVEDTLRTRILDPSRPDLWTVRIDPIDPPPSGTALPDLDAAVTNALESRSDLQRARAELAQSSTSVKYFSNQRLPDVRLTGNYQTDGLGGTRLLRVGGFPGTLVPGGGSTPFGNVLEQVARADYPTWTVGLVISQPIGQSYDDAGLARSRLESQQRERRVKELEVDAIRQVRQAAWQLEMNVKRVQTTRLGRELAEQRLDAEQRRFEVGMSTSFLVIQAQRDLAQARNNELVAQLAYDRSLIDFEAIQLAPATGRGDGGGGGSGVQPLAVGLRNAADVQAAGSIPGQN
jgi:outer membrane protein TolC